MHLMQSNTKFFSTSIFFKSHFLKKEQKYTLCVCAYKNVQLYEVYKASTYFKRNLRKIKITHNP